MNTNILNILSDIHIFAGVLWFGAAIYYLFFKKLLVKSVESSGPQVVGNPVTRRKYPLFMVSISWVTVLAGGLSYFYTSGGFNLAWIRTGPGLGYSLGSLAALVAFLIGNIAIGPTSARMGALGQDLATYGALPTAVQINQLHELEKKLKRAEVIGFLMLTITILTMSTARFWFF